jgi:hypothetical protein
MHQQAGGIVLTHELLRNNQPDGPVLDSGSNAAEDDAFGAYEVSELRWYLSQRDDPSGPPWDEWDSCARPWHA